MPSRSFADTASTFQTLDQRGLVLNMAQTWHQLRPGEIRTDCGGCHAHSQKPTHFALTEAAKTDYKLWDLTERTPLIVEKGADQSQQKWDAEDATGLIQPEAEVVNVEYHRDIKPILARSCASCHTSKGEKQPAGNLDLDADDELVQAESLGKFPGTYYRLALDEGAKFGHKPPTYDSWGYPNASRYVRKFQSRRSLLIWKVLGSRLDGFSNDDHPSESEPGKRDLVKAGQPVDIEKNRAAYDIDFVGSQMPPKESVAGSKVQPLTDADRRTLVRWIDLGCPIDLDFDPANLERRGYGWMLDDNRPVLSMTTPASGENASFNRILIGVHDYYTGIADESLSVVADFEVDGVAAGQNIAAQFKPISRGVLELKLTNPITELQQGKLTVSVKDREGNIARIERSFSVRSADNRP